MDNNVKNLIQATVDQFVGEDRLFTAYDVTKYVRRLTMTNVRHNEAKEEVHGLMTPHIGVTYNREFIQIPGATEKPLLYYPNKPGVSASDYRPGGQTVARQTGRFAQLGKMLPPTPQLPATTDDDDEDSDPPAPRAKKGTCPDRRGRICVPARHVRQIGLRSGLTAYVEVQQGMVTIHSSPPPQYTASYIVDKNDDIRLGRQIATVANLVGKPYQFQSDNSVIHIA